MAILYQGLSLTVLEWFFIPLLFTIVLWLLIPGISGSFLAILEHEVTHMIFAILTFHSPQDINIQRGVGGNFIFKGQGNWLIYLAPYFFPTSASLIILGGLVYTFANQIPPDFYWLAFGIMTGFHLISTLDELHVGQTDFHAAGRFFSILFLPGANLIVYGLLFSYACYGFQGFGQYFQILFEELHLFSVLFL
jgi:hypothetical protein